jgi:hypothetical protein
MILEPKGVGAGGGAAVLGWGSGLLGSSATVRYLAPGCSDQLAEVGEIDMQIPRDGALRNLHVRHNLPDGNGAAITYTVRVNGADTALSVALASTASSASNLVDSVAVSKGDRVSIRVNKAAGVLRSPRNVVATAELS